MSRRGVVAALLAGAWSLLIYANAVVSQPFRLEWVAACFRPAAAWGGGLLFLETLGGNAVAVASLALFDVVVAAAGMIACVWLGERGREASGLVRAATALVLGGALAGVCALGLALAGLAYPAVFGLAAVSGALMIRHALRAGLLPERGTGSLRESLPSKPVCAVGSLVAVVTLAKALAPATADDSLRLFLELPRRALLVHRLIAPEGSILALGPPMSYGVNLMVQALAGQASVKLLSWQAYLLAAFLIHACVREKREARDLAPVAALLWMVLIAVPLLVGTAFPDISLALAVFLAVRAQIFSRRPVTAGALWGLALSMKFQAGFLLMGIPAARIFCAIPGLTRTLLTAAAVMAPWLMRGFLLTGFPMAPLFMDADGDGEAEFLPASLTFARHWAEARGLGGILAAPFTLATRPVIWDAMLSPSVVVLLPLALLPPVHLSLRVIIATACGLWAWQTGYAARYLLPAWPLILVAAAWGAGGRLGQGRARSLVKLAVAAVITLEGFVSLVHAFRVTSPFGVALGLERREAYLARHLSPRPAHWIVGQELGARITATTRYYCVGSVQAHYWPGLPVLDEEGSQSRMARWAGESVNSGRLRVRLRQNGIDWFVHHETAGIFFPGFLPDPGAWKKDARRICREMVLRYALPRGRVSEGGAVFSFYELSRNPMPRPGAIRAGALSDM